MPVIPLIITNSLFFPFITGKNFAFRIIVEIIFAAWLILALRDAKYMPKRSFILWALLAFLGILTLADIFGVDPQRSIWSNFERMEGLITHVHLFLYFVVASTMLLGRKLWDRFFHANIAVSLFVTLYSMLQLAGELVINQGGVRVDGTLGNATYLAVYLLFSIFFLIYFIVANRDTLKDLLITYAAGFGGFILFYLNHIKGDDVSAGKVGIILSVLSLLGIIGIVYFLSKRQKSIHSSIWRIVLYGALLIAEMYVLFFTATRGVILGLAAGVSIIAIALLLFEKQNKFLRRSSAVFLILVVVTAALFIGFKDEKIVRKNPVLSRFSSLFDSDIKTFFSEGEGKSRYLNGKTSLEAFKERPILGWGQNNFNYAFYKYYQPGMFGQEPWFDRAHVVVFDWLVAAGILGLLGYLAILVSAFYYLLRRGTHAVIELPERIIFSALLIGYFIQNLTVFDNIVSYMLFFTLLAFIHSNYSVPIESKKAKKIENVASKLTPFTVPVVVSALLLSLYFTSIKGLMAAETLIDAMSPQKGGVSKNLDYFKQALSYNTFGDREIRDSLAETTGLILASSIDPNLKNSFARLAEEELEKQIGETPEDVRSYFIAGLFHAKEKQYDTAIQYLEEAHSLSPQKQNILVELSVAYISAGEYEKALSSAKQAYELGQNFNQLKAIYAIALIYNGNDKMAESVMGEELYQKYLVTDRRFLPAFAVTGQYDKVIELWKKWIKGDPNNAQYRVSLAAAYLKINDRASAVREIEKAIEIDSKFKKQGEELIKKIREGQSF